MTRHGAWWTPAGGSLPRCQKLLESNWYTIKQQRQAGKQVQPLRVEPGGVYSQAPSHV